MSDAEVQTIGAIAAAIAALASLASVWQTRRIIKAAALPELLVEIAHVRPQGTLAVEVHNAGGGIARDVWFAIAADGQLAMDSAAMFLRSGQSANFGTDIRPASLSGKAVGVVMWRSSSNHVYASNFMGKSPHARPW